MNEDRDDSGLWQWMSLRHRAYLRRASYLRVAVPEWADPARVVGLEAWSDPPPYTFDRVISGFRFCNVFRQLDTVTEWVINRVLLPYADHPNLLMMVAACRWINWPDTLEEAMADRRAWPYELPLWEDGRHLTRLLEARAARGDKVFTGAYMIRAESNRAQPFYGWTKHRYVAEAVIDPVRTLQLWRGATRTEVHAMFDNLYGWGAFMAYEAVTDLTYIPPLRDAVDRDTFVVAGPGALRGLRRLRRTGPPSNEMRDLLAASRYARGHPPGGLAEYVPDLDLRAIEHSLCEFDKWQRVWREEGKMRSRWNEGRTPQ